MLLESDHEIKEYNSNTQHNSKKNNKFKMFELVTTPKSDKICNVQT